MSISAPKSPLVDERGRSCSKLKPLVSMRRLYTWPAVIDNDDLDDDDGDDDDLIDDEEDGNGDDDLTCTLLWSSQTRKARLREGWRTRWRGPAPGAAL